MFSPCSISALVNTLSLSLSLSLSLVFCLFYFRFIPFVFVRRYTHILSLSLSPFRCLFSESLSMRVFLFLGTGASCTPHQKILKEMFPPIYSLASSSIPSSSLLFSFLFFARKEEGKKDSKKDVVASVIPSEKWISCCTFLSLVWIRAYMYMDFVLLWQLWH